MNEIKTKKVVKIMPGKDYVSQEYKTFDLQNTILIGKAGSGVFNELNNIILNLAQEYSPRELGIQYFNTASPDSPWFSETRKLPHMDIRSIYGTNTEEGLQLFTEAIVNVIYSINSRMIESQCEESEDIITDRQHLIVLDVDGKVLSNENAFAAIKCLLHFVSERETGCKVLLAVQDMSDKVCELEEYFDLRILTRTTEKISNVFLGCNLAAIEEDKTGFVWITEKYNPYLKRKLIVPYKPLSLYNKLCKYLCNDKIVGTDVFSISWEESLTQNYITQLSFFTAYIRGKYEANEVYGQELLFLLSNLDKHNVYLKFLDIYQKYIASENKIMN